MPFIQMLRAGLEASTEVVGFRRAMRLIFPDYDDSLFRAGNNQPRRDISRGRDGKHVADEPGGPPLWPPLLSSALARAQSAWVIWAQIGAVVR